MSIDTEKKKGPGRPSDPNAIKYRSVGLRPKEWELFEKWKSENDAETYWTNAFERVAEFIRDFAPGGPMVEKPRDDKGRFLPENGTSKMAICRRKRRERREREEAGKT